MADPVAVRTLRAQADFRLAQAIESMSKRTGVPFVSPAIPAYEPDLKAARTTEAVAEFLERLNLAQEKSK